MNEDNKNSRREFIKSLTVLAGTSALISSLPWLQNISAEEKSKTAASDKVRVGIIGIGSRGTYLLLFLQKNPNVEIAAVCDNYKPHLEKAVNSTKGKVKAFYDYKRLLELKDIDAVVIATPLHEHAHISIDALHAGKHVFCEKSMARTVEDCQKMMQAQKETGKILQIGFQNLFNIKYIKALELIKSGQIGQITQIRSYWHRNNNWRVEVPSPELERKFNWRLYKEYSCGLATELAAHQIQITNWFLNTTPESVMGTGSINFWKDGREVYDNISLIYNYPKDIKFMYDSLTSNKQYGKEEQIMGNKGTIELERGKIFTENPPPAPGILQLINDIEHKTFDVIPLGGASWVPDTASKDKGRFIVNEYPLPDDTQLEMEAFVNAVKTNKPIPRVLEQGFNASIGALLGYQAMESMQLVNWPKELVL